MSAEVVAAHTLCNRLGLHARAASSVVRLVADYDANVQLQCADQSARASSVLELLMLCAQMGTEVRIVATGRQAAEAVAAVGQLVEDRFGEDE